MKLDHFPEREVSSVTKLLCKVADYERDHPVAARWFIVAAIGVVLLVSAVVERAA